MLDDDDDLVSLAFVASASVETPVTMVVGAIRETLGMPLKDLRAARNPDEAFRMLRSRAEQAGVFVLVLGNLGSHHTDLSAEVFRGFALADGLAPFVVVNPKDSAAARCFTLLHELAHLWVGESGISGGVPVDPVEVFCNRVASAFLLPDEELTAFERPVAVSLLLEPADDATERCGHAPGGPRARDGSACSCPPALRSAPPASLERSRQQGQQRVVPQIVVVVEILVPQGDPREARPASGGRSRDRRALNEYHASPPRDRRGSTHVGFRPSLAGTSPRGPEEVDSSIENGEA